jgi:hypothetical protein
MARGGGPNGNAGTSSGPPGTWTLVASGVTALPPGGGAPTVISTFPLPLSTFVYVAFMCFDIPGGAGFSFSEGSVITIPPAGVVYWGLTYGPSVTLQARGGPGTPGMSLNWVVYKVVP